MDSLKSLLGVGIYTVPEAARMAQVSAPRIRRWLRGYTFSYKGEPHSSRPVWTPDLPVLDGAVALSFRDLIEVRFVDHFLRLGVSWKLLRQAAGYAAEIVQSSHPFSTQTFRTDGKRIFADFDASRAKGRKLLDVVRRQYAIREVIEPRLYAGLEFVGKDVVRWFPLVHSKRVVVDPRVSFGQPVVKPEGVPTAILARATKVQGLERTAHWYAVSKKSVQDAIEFEKSLAAAA